MTFCCLALYKVVRSQTEAGFGGVDRTFKIFKIKRELVMKNLLTLFAAIVLTYSVSAQTSLGLKAGANFSNVTMTDQFNDLLNSNLRTGFQVAAFVDVPFGGMFGFQGEIGYVRSGAGFESIVPLSAANGGPYEFFDGVYEPGFYEGNLTLDYLDIPLMIKYIMRGRGVQGFLMAGPHLRFATGASLSDQRTFQAAGEGQVTYLNRELVIGSGANRTISGSDFGISFGGGVTIELDYGHIIIDARYFVGTSNLRNSANPDLAMSNRNIMLNVGYMFPLGGY